jgi:hypothetical protein
MERELHERAVRARATRAAAPQSRSLTSGSHPLLWLQRQVGNRATAQLLGVSADPEVASGFPEILAASRGQGQPLPSDVRAEMEARFNTDLSPVRVHVGDDAARLARAADAVAFTSGADVYLGAGAPRTAQGPGRALLVHELAHVVQQARGPVQASLSGLGVLVSDPNSAEEREAAAVAAGTSAEAVSPAPATAGGTADLGPRLESDPGAVVGRLIQRQHPRGRSSTASVTIGEPAIEYVGWEGGAPGGAGTSPTERVAVRSGEMPAPFRYETEDAAWWFPRLPIVYNSFVLPAAPFTRAYARVLDYRALGVPLDPAALSASTTRILSLRGARPSEAREVHEATTQMTSPDSNVEAAYRRVEAFQSRLLAFGQRLEVARTKISEFETRQDIRREQAALDEVRATKALVEQLLGAAASLIGLAGGLAGAFGSEAVGAKAAAPVGGLAAGGEVLQLLTWPFFHSEIAKYEQRIAELEKKRQDLEKRGLTLELGIAQLDLDAVAKEMEAQKIGFEQAVLARRQQAATLGVALEAAHPHSSREIGSGTITAVIGMANAVREAAFFAHETLAQLQGVDLYDFIKRARYFNYVPGDDSPVHRDKKRMLVDVATLFEYKELLLAEEPVLAGAARAWTSILAVPTGGVGGY